MLLPVPNVDFSTVHVACRKWICMYVGRYVSTKEQRDALCGINTYVGEVIIIEAIEAEVMLFH